jgi:ribosomal protein L19E
MAYMLHEIIGWIVAALLGLGIAHLYYRRAKADNDAALASLRADIEHLVPQGVVSVERDVAGQIKSVKARRHHRRRMRHRREARKAGIAP